MNPPPPWSSLVHPRVPIVVSSLPHICDVGIVVAKVGQLASVRRRVRTARLLYLILCLHGKKEVQCDAAVPRCQSEVVNVSV